MNVISEANESVLQILKRFRREAEDWRPLHYCTEIPVDGGILIFNLLTRELIQLSEEEYKNLIWIDYLKDHWFIVPKECNEKEYVNFVRWVVTTRQKKTQNITAYTIFTTTDCNARCFYCFERGRSQIPMGREVALKTVQYIKEHCSGEEVHLSWFGGEPLLNRDAIETICNGLCRERVSFTSTMTTNGFLFDEDLIQKSVTEWNLKKVQITLDGTEEVYNRIKAFIYRDGSAYRKVLGNIGHLLDASVAVTIRLNMGLHNAENLLELVDELGREFTGRKGLSVYAHHIFEEDKPLAETYTEEDWNIRNKAMCNLKACIALNGLASNNGIRKKLKLNHCMADSGRSVTILPTGDIGLCEHHSEREFIGHLHLKDIDMEMMESWKETVPEIPECETCFYYPDCYRLKKCASSRVCFELLRMDYLESTKQAMRNEYKIWSEHTKKTL